jgi:hypothetical protein
MGCYVNPSDVSKEVWLLAHGVEVGRIDLSAGIKKIPTWESFEFGCIPVVLVDSGPFTAAAVAYSPVEYGVFVDLEDERYREIYSVSVEDLREVSDIADYLRRR